MGSGAEGEAAAAVWDGAPVPGAGEGVDAKRRWTEAGAHLRAASTRVRSARGRASFMFPDDRRARRDARRFGAFADDLKKVDIIALPSRLHDVA